MTSTEQIRKELDNYYKLMEFCKLNKEAQDRLEQIGRYINYLEECNKRKKELQENVMKELDNLDEIIHTNEGRINIDGKECNEYDSAGGSVLFVLKLILNKLFAGEKE